MKRGLEEAGLKRHLMTQPLAFKTPDVNKQGFIDLPEFPFGKLRFILACLLLYLFKIFYIFINY